jgi:hypothetical protein
MIIIAILNRIKCRLGYHKYYVMKELNPWSRKLGCKNCNCCFGMNDDSKTVIAWDYELEQLYKIIGEK